MGRAKAQKKLAKTRAKVVKKTAKARVKARKKGELYQPWKPLKRNRYDDF